MVCQASTVVIAAYWDEGEDEDVDAGAGELLSLLRVRVVCQASTARIPEQNSPRLPNHGVVNAQPLPRKRGIPNLHGVIPQTQPILLIQNHLRSEFRPPSS